MVNIYLKFHILKKQMRLCSAEANMFMNFIASKTVYGIRCIGTYSSAKFEYIKIYNIYESI